MYDRELCLLLKCECVANTYDVRSGDVTTFLGPCSVMTLVQAVDSTVQSSVLWSVLRIAKKIHHYIARESEREIEDGLTTHISPHKFLACMHLRHFGGTICGSEEGRYIWAIAVIRYIWALALDTTPHLDNVTDDHL